VLLPLLAKRKEITVVKKLRRNIPGGAARKGSFGGRVGGIHKGKNIFNGKIVWCRHELQILSANYLLSAEDVYSTVIV
jgi:hypothetical protein